MLPTQLFNSVSEQVITCWQSGNGLPHISGLPAAFDQSLCDSLTRASTRHGRPLRFISIFVGSNISHRSIYPWLRDLILHDLVDEHAVPATFLIDLGHSPSRDILQALAVVSAKDVPWRSILISRHSDTDDYEGALPALTSSFAELETIYTWAASRASLRPAASDLSELAMESQPHAIECTLLRASIRSCRFQPDYSPCAAMSSWRSSKLSACYPSR